MNKWAQESVNELMQQGTHNSITEALLICISSLKDRDGKCVIVRLHPDFNEHIFLCEQIATMLIGGKNETSHTG
jgi:hypothetical protein